MIYLILSIICSTSIVLIFRAFPKYKIESFQAIVFNYLVCISLGLLTTKTSQFKLIPEWSGLQLTLFLGAIFIFLFYVIARTTQTLGVAVSTVAQKLSFIVPVTAGILAFNEGGDFIKILGIALGILSVFLISIKASSKTEKTEQEKKSLIAHLWMPAVVFLGSGCADLLVKIIQTNHLSDIETSTFTVILFVAAFITGSLRLIFSKANLKLRNLWAGILLGFPNYGSVYFLIMALQHAGLESSQIFPINNIGIILSAAILGWLIYSEKLHVRQLIGLAIAIAAIFLLV